jgi:hypothetical protein
MLDRFVCNALHPKFFNAAKGSGFVQPGKVEQIYLFTRPTLRVHKQWYSRGRSARPLPRLYQRVLMFHHFPDEPDVDRNCLVRSTDFNYSDEQNPADAINPIYSFLFIPPRGDPHRLQAAAG